MLAKLLTNRTYNWEAFMTTMRKIWRTSKTIRVHEVDLDIVMFKFEDRQDKERVLRKSSWNFDKCLLLLKEFEGRHQTNKLNFIEALF